MVYTPYDFDLFFPILIEPCICNDSEWSYVSLKSLKFTSLRAIYILILGNMQCASFLNFYIKIQFYDNGVYSKSCLLPPVKISEGDIIYQVTTFEAMVRITRCPTFTDRVNILTWQMSMGRFQSLFVQTLLFLRCLNINAFLLSFCVYSVYRIFDKSAVTIVRLMECHLQLRRSNSSS